MKTNLVATQDSRHPDPLSGNIGQSPYALTLQKNLCGITPATWHETVYYKVVDHKVHRLFNIKIETHFHL